MVTHFFTLITNNFSGFWSSHSRNPWYKLVGALWFSTDHCMCYSFVLCFSNCSGTMGFFWWYSGCTLAWSCSKKNPYFLFDAFSITHVTFTDYSFQNTCLNSFLFGSYHLEEVLVFLVLDKSLLSPLTMTLLNTENSTLKNRFFKFFQNDNNEFSSTSLRLFFSSSPPYSVTQSPDQALDSAWACDSRKARGKFLRMMRAKCQAGEKREGS